MGRLRKDFYTRDVLKVAPDLLGKELHIRNENGHFKYIISDVEAYRGMDDRACHASKGKTDRTEVMFEEGGVLYIYLIYGMYWMMNIVTSGRDVPQAVLIRGFKEITGPGRITRELEIDSTFNNESLITSSRIWLTDAEPVTVYNTGPRIGIDYAGEPWVSLPWRFYL